MDARAALMIPLTLEIRITVSHPKSVWPARALMKFFHQRRSLSKDSRRHRDKSAMV
jgi:hypothetical protein